MSWRFSATTLVADISLRSTGVRRRSGIGVSHMSPSIPSWCEACPVSIGPPRGCAKSPISSPRQPTVSPGRRQPLQKRDQRRMAPGTVARGAHHLPVRAVGRHFDRAGQTALCVGTDRLARPRCGCRGQPEDPPCGILRQRSQYRLPARRLFGRILLRAHHRAAAEQNSQQRRDP